GGGAGIGEAIARRYAREGAKVVIAEIDAGRGESTQKAIRESGGEALHVKTDVTSEDQVLTLTKSAEDAFGRVDILVNNAAILITRGDGRAHEVTNEVWD